MNGNPQTEDGFTKIANEIMEALAKITLSSSEAQILWSILRKTYGWHKKEDAISFSQLQNSTFLSRRAVIYALQNLEAKKIVKIKRNGTNPNIIGFLKNYTGWLVQENTRQYRQVIEKRKLLYKSKLVQEKATSARNGKMLVQENSQLVQTIAPTKEIYTKETIQKKGEAKASIVLTDYFYKIYQENTHSKYSPSFAKDRKQANILLKTFDIEDLKNRIEDYFVGEHWFTKDEKFTFGGYFNHINEIGVKKKGAKHDPDREKIPEKFRGIYDFAKSRQKDEIDGTKLPNGNDVPNSELCKPENREGKP